MTFTPTNQPRRVKARFIGLVAVALTLVMSMFAVALYLVERNIRTIDLAEQTAAVATLFEQKLAKDANLMEAVLRVMITNHKIETAFVAQNRGALAQTTSDLFNDLRTDYRLTHLYFHDPALVNLYRVHSPNHFGDTITRITSLNAQKTLAPVSGLELGRLGTLTLRTVMPWTKADKLLGFVEIGEEIEHLVTEISQSLNVGVIVLLQKDRLNHTEWSRGLELMQRTGHWEAFPDHVVVTHTGPSQADLVTPKVLEALIAGDSKLLEHDGKTLHLALVPLKDVRQRHIGELVVMHDISGMQSTFRWSVGLVTLAGILVAAGVLGIFYVALGQVERDYQRQHELEREILKLNTDHQRILQMEKLSTLGTMVGGIAHQLNNPLVGVVNMAQLASREPANPAQTQSLLAEIRKAGEDCRIFVRRMLEFSKVSSFVSKPTTLIPLIEETVLMFHQAERRRHPVELAMPTQTVTLDLDPVLLRHALFNLLLNAAQATTEGAPIVIGLAEERDQAGGREGWSLTVTNQGPVIASDVMSRIFEPFFTTRADGTGLGLPVVQHVALVHGGHVRVESNPTLGTRFAIWLPLLGTPP